MSIYAAQVAGARFQQLLKLKPKTMKKVKLSLDSVKIVLTRSELRKITAGGSGCGVPGDGCSSNCCSGRCGTLNGGPGGGGGYLGCL